MKKASIIAFIAGIVLLAVGFALPIIFEIENSSKTNPSETLYQLELTFKLCGGITAVWGLIGLIFNKQMNSRCTLKTSGFALGISATVSLGLYCVLSFLSCYFLTTPDKHPIRHPASFILGIICFLVFIVLIALYIKSRKENMSAAGIVFDVVLGVLYLPAFGCIWVIADNIVSRLFE